MPPADFQNYGSTASAATQCLFSSRSPAGATHFYYYIHCRTLFLFFYKNSSLNSSRCRLVQRNISHCEPTSAHLSLELLFIILSVLRLMSRTELMSFKEVLEKSRTFFKESITRIKTTLLITRVKEST